MQDICVIHSISVMIKFSLMVCLRFNKSNYLLQENKRSNKIVKEKE